MVNAACELPSKNDCREEVVLEILDSLFFSMMVAGNRIKLLKNKQGTSLLFGFF